MRAAAEALTAMHPDLVHGNYDAYITEDEVKEAVRVEAVRVTTSTSSHSGGGGGGSGGGGGGGPGGVPGGGGAAASLSPVW